jgi:hypothetical protein
MPKITDKYGVCHTVVEKESFVNAQGIKINELYSFENSLSHKDNW